MPHLSFCFFPNPLYEIFSGFLFWTKNMLYRTVGEGGGGKMFFWVFKSPASKKPNPKFPPSPLLETKSQILFNSHLTRALVVGVKLQNSPHTHHITHSPHQKIKIVSFSTYLPFLNPGKLRRKLYIPANAGVVGKSETENPPGETQKKKKKPFPQDNPPTPCPWYFKI